MVYIQLTKFLGSSYIVYRQAEGGTKECMDGLAKSNILASMQYWATSGLIMAYFYVLTGMPSVFQG